MFFFIIFLEEEKKKNIKVRFGLKPTGKINTSLSGVKRKPPASHTAAAAIFNQEEDEDDDNSVGDGTSSDQTNVGFKPKKGKHFFQS